ncbi:hypothetical protein CNBH3000 [Cryptococcus deneoformans B-3501A]|uniref:hypothetical protein n=1 Tax=Cryptococcus deneoformans (strain B-3501A) TaxID=283643 RepID=UPI000042E7F5|nr:hypothetical protein CNBH3000 [Cryptococcus neoformans var. neoformans B-3501A]EAL19201.1 hypothetical protein CNBH3000 [Cryptococcus neoformans var. neoformans B-3501A]
MLEDEDIAKTGLIYWSANGTTFTCPNPTEFSKVVLPRYFKHNNWQSFVRQLNMYSYVNDIYSTSTDPQAWEFRHSLFRRGEAHLLPSIKRKSSRPSAPDGSNTVTSPTDELPPSTSNPIKPVAGWMRDAVPVPYRMPSPPHIHGQPQRSATYPYSDGFATRKDDGRSPTRGMAWDPLPAVQRMPPPPDNQIPIRYHPDPNRPVLTTQRFYHPGYPESPLYGPAHSPSAETLLNQMSVLEDKVQKLTDVLNNDRIEHVRNNLDFTSYLLQMIGWAAGDQHTLSRQNADMRHKYEAFMASDALAIMASGGGRERSDSRDSTRERNARLGFEIPPFPGHPHPSITDLRLPQTAQSSSSAILSQRAAPRTSPRNSTSSDLLLTRPSTSESIREREIYPTYFPPQTSHGIGPASSIPSRGPETITPSLYGGGPSVPPPLYRPAPIVEKHREIEKGEEHKDMNGPSTVELGREERDNEDSRMTMAGEEAESKTGLRNLLN